MIDTTYAKVTTPIKSFLLQREWSEAIQLLVFLVEKDPKGFEAWVRNGSTIQLREICEPFRNWNYYRDRCRKGEPLPFANDVDALDTTWGYLDRDLKKALAALKKAGVA